MNVKSLAVSTGGKKRRLNESGPLAKVCGYCGCGGHNTRNCPQIGLELHKRLQRQHSPGSVAEALKEADAFISLHGVDRRSHHRKAVKKSKYRQQWAPSARRFCQSPRAQPRKRWKRVSRKRRNDQRRVEKQSVRRALHVPMACLSVSKAWSWMRSRGFVQKAGRYGWPCFKCCAACKQAF